jgi:hypothetical protein
MEARLIWLLDYITPYLQIGFAAVLLICGLLCFWSVWHRYDLGVLLLAIYCIGSCISGAAFGIFAYQDGEPFFPALSFEARSHAYLCGRLLGPWNLVLFAVSVCIIALHNLRGRPKV